MTPSELKASVEATGSYFFTRKSMKFFGDTMKNYGCRKATVENRHGEKCKVYELYRKSPVDGGLKNSSFFDRKTFKRVFQKN